MKNRLMKTLTFSMALAMMIIPIGVLAAEEESNYTDDVYKEARENSSEDDVLESEAISGNAEYDEFDFGYVYEKDDNAPYIWIEENKLGRVQYTCSKNGVVMWSSPYSGRTKVTTLNKGTILREVSGNGNDWIKVTDGKNTGYVEKRYLSKK